MSRHVNAISNRLSLRPPQRESLERLHHVCELIPLRRNTGQEAILESALEIIHSEYPTVTDFERDFPSLCFALATGVGKTRLMGAFITYLHLAHGIKNFFVLAPNLTIYEKLIADFTPGTRKYVFKGIAEFATDQPEIITGDNYEKAATITDFIRCKINIFNISKINTEVRGGKSPRIKRLSEYIGQSYFDYLAELDDLVILMDESHRYRASAGVRAINELKPILGLELTATPIVETKKKGESGRFKNVIYDYPLGKAIADGFVKDPTVVTRQNFSPAEMSRDDIERLKLEDGIRLHESIKTELYTYARETDSALVKPFVLVIARDTTHAAELLALIESEAFFSGRYTGKAIQVDSSTKKKEEQMVERLLQVESTEEPTEIVIHVNMLKEGWDVTNLYTIIPLRAANARILIKQSIGRGLRLPYGKRTGVPVVDRLNIIAHDKFQEIIEEANRADSVIKLQRLVLTDEALATKTTFPVVPKLNRLLGYSQPAQSGTEPSLESAAISQAEPIFTTPEEQALAQLTHKVIQGLERQPELVPNTAALQSAEIQSLVKEKVEELYKPAQLSLEGVTPSPEIAAIVEKATKIVTQQTIDIPKIIVVPVEPIETGFHPFALDLASLNYQPPEEMLWLQSLSTGVGEALGIGEGNIYENRLEDYVVNGLVDFDDISYYDHADFLYGLAQQVVEHFRKTLSEEDTRKVLRFYQPQIASFIHTQMQPHFWEKAKGYEAIVHSGFTTALKEGGATVTDRKVVLDYRRSPADKSNMSQYVFTGFSRCLYNAQKFDSESERLLAVILERDALKWFRPAKGEFKIYYRASHGQVQYQPDFVAETAETIYLLEPKMKTQMAADDVLAKKTAAVQWCQYTSTHAQKYDGKPWVYILIPHDAIAQNMTLQGIVNKFGERP